MNKGAEKTIQDGDVLVRELGALRRLTLNRPKALNALTLGMATTMTACLRAWADDDTAGVVLIDGAGERGLCAGGDLRALYDAAKAKDSLPAKFWATEYHLDVLIARYPKPVVAIMDGVVMGGGVGVSAHAAHRVVTERSSIAMPEVSIGYFPDVGASFLLARSPGHVGRHLALTGSRIGADDAIYCGLADIQLPVTILTDLPARLADCGSAQDVRAALHEVSALPAPGKLPAARTWIDDCYGAENVEGILARLRASKADDARSALATLEKMSPTSLKITLRNIRSAVSFKTVEESFQQDYRISLACIAEHDFIEGIRATIVDKDRNPVWRPAKLEDVTQDIVDRHFRSVGALELNFTD
ncbi:MAG: enoyl-CoA hydratase/isomerase family protein [Xanthobacteraceae bacterium]